MKRNIDIDIDKTIFVQFFSAVHSPVSPSEEKKPIATEDVPPRQQQQLPPVPSPVTTSAQPGNRREVVVTNTVTIIDRQESGEPDTTIDTTMSSQPDQDEVDQVS